MKKTIIFVVIIACFASVHVADAQTKFRAFTALTGGGTGAVDKIPIAELTNGDIGFCATSSYFYVHRFDSSATNAESSPSYIRPDDYATAGVLVLIGLYGVSIAGVPNTQPTIAFKDSDATAGDDNADIYVNCTDTGNGTEDCDMYIRVQKAGTITTKIQIDADGTVIFPDGGIDISAAEGITLSNDETITNGDNTEIAFNGTESLALDLDTGTANQVEWKNKTTGSTGVTDMSFAALNLATTGTIQGAIKINSDANGMTSGEMTTAGMYGTLFVATGAGTWNLPAAAAGMSFCMLVPTAAAVVINPDDSDVLVYDGTADTAGHQISGGAANGDFICFIAVDTTNWHSMGRRGTWTPGS